MFRGLCPSPGTFLTYWPGGCHEAVSVRTGEKKIEMEGCYRLEAIGVVDTLQVLEGATYLAFIVGALVAVYELRSMSKDRKTELMMRMNEHWCSRDFEEALLNIKELDTKDPREMEGKCGKVSLWMVVDYDDTIAAMAYYNLLDRKFVLQQIAFDIHWEILQPWIVDMRQKIDNPFVGASLEWAAAETLRTNPTRSQLT